MFALHYYNRFLFEREDTTIRITNLLEAGDEIRYTYASDGMRSELTGAAGSMCLRPYAAVDGSDLPLSSLVFYIRSGDQLMCRSRRLHADEDRQQFHVNTQLYGHLNMPASGSAEQAFLYLADYFSQADVLDRIFYADELPADEQEEVPEEYIVAILETDPAGKVRTGVRWVDASVPFYEAYQDGAVVTKEVCAMEDFQETATVFFEAMMAMQG